MEAGICFNNKTFHFHEIKFVYIISGSIYYYYYYYLLYLGLLAVSRINQQRVANHLSMRRRTKNFICACSGGTYNNNNIRIIFEIYQKTDCSSFLLQSQNLWYLTILIMFSSFKRAVMDQNMIVSASEAWDRHIDADFKCFTYK